MLDLARRTAPGATFQFASIHEATLPWCVAITALGEPLAYIAPDEPNPGSFGRRAFDALTPGGIFIFDVVLRDPAEPMRYRAERQGTDWRVEVIVEEAPDRALLTRRIRIDRVTPSGTHTSEETHRLRIFDAGVLARTLREVGFEVRTSDSYGTYCLPPHRRAFIARKPARR